jgi:branched-chain amino acid transport system ATP-binding protein
LLLDEPSAAVNRDSREDLARFILRIKHGLRIGILWVEHGMPMVADVVDRLYVVDYGRRLADGAPESVLERSAGHRGRYRFGISEGIPSGPPQH